MSQSTSEDPRRHLPGVDRILEVEGAVELILQHGHTVVADAVRRTLDEVRESLSQGGSAPAAEVDAHTLLARAAQALTATDRAGLRRVINATGVVLHTNLGRAPLAPSVSEAMRRAALGYSNLEFDLQNGVRGSRYDHCVDEIRALTGAEDAVVVNNCAAGLVLAMSALARGREVAISRGELVEIGGGFRIPEMLEQAGATLHEVGATNRTRLADYASALDSVRVALILKVHRSNFRMEGFTEEAGLAELSDLAAQRGVPLVHDLGSGLLISPERLGLPFEPRPMESLASGADVVIFSGDKLLGGPQAGIVAGSAELIGRLRSSPLCRAFRVDKVTLAGLRATLRLARDADLAVREIPALRALAATAGEVKVRAESLAQEVSGRLGLTAGDAEHGLPATGSAGGARLEIEVVGTMGRVGGGTYPNHSLEGFAVRVRGTESGWDPSALAGALRTPPADSTEELLPVVARVEDGALFLDLRAVLPGEEDALTAAVVAALR